MPLPARLLAGLDAHHKRSVYNQDDALVLCHPHTGKPIESNDLLEWFRRACDRAGVGRLRPDGKPRRIHDLRHTYGTSLAASGVPLRTIQGYFGHQHCERPPTSTPAVQAGRARRRACRRRVWWANRWRYGDNTTPTQPP